MLANDRHKKILEKLEKNNSVKSSELVKIFGVTLETIRRDLAFLEKKGELNRVHGGAVFKAKKLGVLTSSQPVYAELESLQKEKEVARIAAREIEEAETIALNNGNVNLELAKELKGSNKSLTIITNSLSIMNELADCEKINVILAGGLFNRGESAFIGEITAFYLDVFSVDKAFICSEGISLKKGITDFSMDRILVSKKMMDIATDVYAITESSKIEGNALMKTCNINDIDFVVTDSSLDDKIKEMYKRKGIKLINK